MPGSRPQVSGATVAVVVAMLIAVGVALATRAAPPAAAGTSGMAAQTATPQALSMGGAVPTTTPATKPTWAIRSRQPRVSNLAAVFFVDDQEGFAGGYGTLLVTQNGGSSWTTASIPDVGGALAAFACASRSECVAGGWTATDAAQLLYTRDGGATWQPATLPPNLRDLSHVACWGASHCVAVGQGTGQDPWEMTSTDAGRTWTPAESPPAIKSLTVFTCSVAGTCLAGGGSAAFVNPGPSGVGVIDRSGDGGTAWQPVTLPQVPPVCGTPPAGTYGCSGPLGKVATSTTTTQSWPPILLSCPTQNMCVEVNHGSVDLVSTDGGATWSGRRSGRVIGCRATQAFCPAFQPSAITFVTTTIGWRATYDPCGGFNFATESYQSCPATVEKTTDGGRSWTASATTDYLPSISCPDANHCWAAETTNSGGNVISTADGGAHWSVDAFPGSGLLSNLTCATSSLCFASGSGPSGDPSILRSRDGGRSWVASTIPTPPADASTANLVGPRDTSLTGLACLSATVCIASTNAQVIESTDGGDSWAITWSPPPRSGAGKPILFGITCPTQSVCIAASNAGLFRSADSGRTWAPAGPASAGSLDVACSPAGVCVADDLGSGGPRRTAFEVSRDGGANWQRESVALPRGLTKNNTATSDTPSEVYYVSCWTRERCAAVGLAYGVHGARRWYELETGDAGRSWSSRTLPEQIYGVGSLACGAGGQCLVAGSTSDHAALWSLHGSTVRRLAGPTWSRFAWLTSLVCPAAGNCVGTAQSNNAAFVFAVSVPPDASGWTDSLPTPRAAFSNVGVDVASAAVAASAALFITFPSQLFNLTFQENYAEIAAWEERARRRLRRLARGFGIRSTRKSAPATTVTSGGAVEHENRSRPAEALAVGLAGALLGTLLNPAIAFDTATLAGYVGVALALVASMACIGGSLAMYRWRRDLHDPLHVRALPLGLVVAAGCVVVSRLANFEPGYLYGVVCGVALGRRLREHEEAHVAALSTAATLALAAISWAVWVPVHDAADHGGFAANVLASALVALVVSGLVNTVIVLLPLRFLAGWTLIRWRRAVWAAAFVVALFGLIALLARSPVSPAAHASPLAATIAMFLLFGGGSIVFREYFDRKWRQAHGVELHGLRAHIRELFSVRPTEDVAVLSAPGSAQVVMEDDDDAPS